jgi:ferredoxin
MEVPMRVVVDPVLCESNALCAGLAPAVFELGEDDMLTVLDERPDEDLRADVHAAATACPKRAITVVDD